MEALRLPDETLSLLRELGLEQVAQVVELPRAELASRLGPLVLRRLDELTGEVEESIVPLRPPPEIAAECSLEEPVARREVLESLVKRLLEEALGRLPPQRGALRLICRLLSPQAAPVEIEVGLFRPTADAARLFELLRTRWDSLRLRSPVSGLRVEAPQQGPLEVRQGRLFEDVSKKDPPRDPLAPAAGLLERLTARLGRRRVLRPSLADDHLPERAWRASPCVEETPPTKRSKKKNEAPPSPEEENSDGLGRPLRLLASPTPLEAISVAPDGPPLRFRVLNELGGFREHRVRRAWGPERIETGWWRGPMRRRDYYRVEDETGRWFWIFRHLPDGRWYLHGTFC